jgi:MOSC domain-containing protein YiiM
MNSRVIEHVAGTRDRWALAGDQVYVDMNLSIENLPPGTRLRLGDAIIEVSDTPHTGCKKFASRYGAEALRFVNIGVGRESRFRGMNAFVVQGGEFGVGSPVVKLPDRAE